MKSFASIGLGFSLLVFGTFGCSNSDPEPDEVITADDDDKKDSTDKDTSAQAQLNNGLTIDEQVEAAEAAFEDDRLRTPEALPHCGEDDWKAQVMIDDTEGEPATRKQMCQVMSDYATSQRSIATSSCNEVYIDEAECVQQLDATYDRCSCYIDNMLHCLGTDVAFGCDPTQGILVPTSATTPEDEEVDENGMIEQLGGLSLRYCQVPWLAARECITYVWYLELDGGRSIADDEGDAGTE